MRILIILIWIFIFFDRIENIKVVDFNPKDANAFFSNEQYHNSKNNTLLCPLNCRHKTKNEIVVQTSASNRTQVNVPLQNGTIAVVYYSCNDSVITNRPKGDQYYTFHKLCEKNFEQCTYNSQTLKKHWNTLSSDEQAKLSINLTIPFNMKSVKIRTEKCGKDPIIFTFKVDDKPIDYRQEPNDYKYTDNHFIANNLMKMPITLEIKKFPEEILANITFNIKKVMRQNCSSVIKQHCPRLCKNGIIKRNGKCRIPVGNRTVTIATKPKICSTKGRIANVPEETVSEGVCDYFARRNSQLCEQHCIDLENCTYMCLQEGKNKQLNESGYLMNKQYKGLFGSGAWTWINVPTDLVFSNECADIQGLCKNPYSCEDLSKGYRCKYNDYNDYTCLNHKGNRFKQCKYDIEKYVINEEKNPTSTKEAESFLDKIFKSKLSPKHKFIKIFTSLYSYMSSNKSDEASDNEEKNDNITLLFLRKFQEAYNLFIYDLLKENTKEYRKTEKNVFTYSRVVKKTDREIEIPVSEQNQTDDKQFVKFKIRRPIDSNKTEILRFMRYENLDVANEEKKLKKVINNGSLKVSLQERPEETNTWRFKNSDMIYLSFEQTKNISVQFRLKMSHKVEAPNWLYSAKEECGYLASDGWTWAVDGCRKVEKSGQSYCECDHLSNFAMLFSMKLVNEHHLVAFQYLSVIGGIINIVSLLLFLIFVLFINTRDKMRIDQLNIAICLLVGTLAFLLGGFAAQNYYSCKIMALLTQYLLLSAFIWMLILGVNVVRMIASVKFQNEDWLVKYRIAILVIGYGVSLIIVALSGYFFWYSYGQVSDYVCWIRYGDGALLTFIVLVGIILAVNIIGLFLIANTLIRNYINTRKIRVNESNELFVFLQLLVSMGFTWFPSYFATHYLAGMYLFVICFPLQGLMMFLCVVVLNKENREKVSSYVLMRYSSLISKSTTSGGSKSHSKSKSTSNSKSTEQNQSLLSDTEKERSEWRDKQESRVPMVEISNQDKTDLLQSPAC